MCRFTSSGHWAHEEHPVPLTAKLLRSAVGPLDGDAAVDPENLTVDEGVIGDRHPRCFLRVQDFGRRVDADILRVLIAHPMRRLQALTICGRLCPEG